MEKSFYKCPLSQPETEDQQALASGETVDGEEAGAFLDMTSVSTDLQKLSQQLELTEEQQEIVIPVLQQTASDKKRIIEENWGQGELGSERLKSGLKELELLTFAKLDEHLTDEQMTDFRQIQAERSQRFWEEMAKSGRLKKKGSGRGFSQSPGQGMDPEMMQMMEQKGQGGMGGRRGGRGGGGMRGGY
ncbi:MAG: hypothetical protein ACYTG7_12865 [Planctomycetota bacterium]|jgi:hypothetical protein